MVEKLERLKREIKNTQVVILAGGSAKRMGKIDRPKALLELREGYTLLDYEIDLYRGNGFEDFVFVLGHRHEEIEDYIEKMGYMSELNIRISVDPTTENWGKGKALKYAIQQEKIRRGRFIVSYPDDLKLDEYLPTKLLLNHLYFVSRYKSLGTMVVTTGVEFPFGVATVNEEGRITSFVEKPLLNKLVNIGLCAFEEEVMDIINMRIDMNSPRPAEFDEEITYLVEKEKMYAFTVPPSTWIPVNDLKSYERARRIFADGELVGKSYEV